MGEDEQRLYPLDAWRETPYYSERERATLVWAEAVVAEGRRRSGTTRTYSIAVAPPGHLPAGGGRGRVSPPPAPYAGRLSGFRLGSACSCTGSRSCNPKIAAAMAPPASGPTR